MLKKSKKVPCRVPVIFWIVIAFNILVLTMGAYYVYNTREIAIGADNFNLKSLITSATEGLQTVAPRDPKNGNVYIWQSNLWLPANKEEFSSEIKYSYIFSLDGGVDELTIANTHAINSLLSSISSSKSSEDLLNVVPELQACYKGYQLSFSQVDGSQNPLKFTKLLADGRMLYVYKNRDCSQTSEAFESYLNKIDSY